MEEKPSLFDSAPARSDAKRDVKDTNRTPIGLTGNAEDSRSDPFNRQ
ncbi:hypothetical protein [Burkholderia alba]|nr:hypothetical protein [Burkholderia alba]